ncbi:hypothetical protein ACIPSE_16705 [Streptomyces sp. NPDC090106]|uniref:hypothetical protein n=1 Tax=Streptomyces sp. NPDC090106 TaxID=3365946 RepID=UPI00381A7778
MTTPHQASHLPSVALRGRSGALWAEDGKLLLEQDGVRRRIPLAAVEEVRAATAAPHGVEVVLTASGGAAPTVYRLAHRKAAETAVFVSAVNAALPPGRDRDGVDGESLVVSEQAPPRSSYWRSGDWVIWAVVGVLGGGWAAGFVTLLWHSDLIGAILWVLGTKPLIGGLAVYFLAGSALYDRAILRRRGVTVLATRSHSTGKKEIYAFTDLEGVRRECEPDSAAEPVSAHTTPRRVQVSYDPRKPDRVAARLPVRTWVARTLGVAVFGTAMLYAGLWMVPYQLVQVLF